MTARVSELISHLAARKVVERWPGSCIIKTLVLNCCFMPAPLPSLEPTGTLENPDQTREKLLAAASEVFAQRGFQAATVREICERAGANVAAVNYYFRDKMGLYVAVLSNSVYAAADGSIAARLSACKSPDEALRLQIFTLLYEACGHGISSVHVRLMTQELAQPTPALARVIDQVIRPRYLRLRETIGAILNLPPDDDTTRLCAHSIIGQVVHYIQGQPVISRVWPKLEMTEERIQQIATHISDFSLCSLHSMAKSRSRSKRPERKPK